MNNKGFIATSVLYSFFLIFITLFLGIIAEYLQDKVLLNTIEKGIKEEINDDYAKFDDYTILTIINDDTSEEYKYCGHISNPDYEGGKYPLWFAEKDSKCYPYQYTIFLEDIYYIKKISNNNYEIYYRGEVDE